MTTTTNNQIGGNYIVLCYEITGAKRRNNLRGSWYVYWSRHFGNRDDASGYAINRPGERIRRWLCERVATLFDDGKKAVVRYAVMNYKGEQIGGVDVTWIRDGEPIWTTNQRGDFRGYGAGIGWEGSDYATEVHTDIN